MYVWMDILHANQPFEEQSCRKTESRPDGAFGVTFPNPYTSHLMTPAVTEEA